MRALELTLALQLLLHSLLVLSRTRVATSTLHTWRYEATVMRWTLRASELPH